MVFELAVVGPVDVFQQTPLTVTADPPILLIAPLPVAVVGKIDVTAEVVRIGTLAVDAKAVEPVEKPSRIANITK